MLNTKNLTADFDKNLHVNDYTKNLVNSIRVVKDKDVFTQVEKDFVIQFLVNTLDGLTNINIESRQEGAGFYSCLLYTSPSPRDLSTSRMPSSA